MNDNHTPKQWMNVCEASGFIMFFPIVFYGMGYYYFKTKKTDPLLIAVSIFLLLGLIYVLIGFPGFLSKITLFSMSPATRALPIVGVGSSVLLICYLASDKAGIKKEKISWVEFGVLASAILVFMLIVVSFINRSTQNFFSKNEATIAITMAVITYLLIRYKNFRFALPSLCIFLIGWVLPNARINPVTKGLAPILENPLVMESKLIHDQDPQGRWAVFGDARLTHLLKANGINLLNSVKLVPPMSDLKVLDPTGQRDSVYNRYAWITMNSKQIANNLTVNWGDTVIFRQSSPDGYSIFIDPCSPKMKQLRVKYFVFDYVPSPQEVRCMTKLKENAGIFIYKRNDQ
jgi:hypothetical protein